MTQAANCHPPPEFPTKQFAGFTRGSRFLVLGDDEHDTCEHRADCECRH
jgi:hypothetical protein